jgi:hypothetical protein
MWCQITCFTISDIWKQNNKSIKEKERAVKNYAFVFRCRFVLLIFFYHTMLFFYYNNRPPSAVSFMPALASTSGRLHSEFVRLLFLQAHRETDRFFAASGVQLAQTNPCVQFHFRRTAFGSILKSRVGNILTKTTALRINLNLDGTPIASKSHTHPSHSQTSRLLTSSLSLGVPVPRPTQCMRGA